MGAQSGKGSANKSLSWIASKEKKSFSISLDGNDPSLIIEDMPVGSD